MGLRVQSEGCSRRALLKCGAVAACVPVVTQLGGCAPRIADPLTLDLPAPVNGLVSVDISRVPELTNPGGSLLLRPDALDDLGRRLSILVVQASNSAVNTTEANPSGLYAFDAYCPHAGCEVAWDDGATQVVCPCHLSRFDISGNVIHPPAVENIDTYPVRINKAAQTINVDLSGSAGVFPAVSNGTVSFDLSALSGASDPLAPLQTIGGSVTGRSQGVAYPLLVMRTGQTDLLAFDARCPHLGCSVKGATTYIICPCHGSIFGLDGTVEAGPALTGLLELAVQFDGTNAVVTIA